MANLSKTTQDHEEIRRWAEERGGKPAHVKSTGSGDDVGILRIDFPGYSGEGSLEPISWDDWFEKFDENNLALLYEEETASGERSNFNKIVKAETAQEVESGSHRKRGSGPKRAGAEAASKRAGAEPASKRAGTKTASKKGRSQPASKKAGAKKTSAQKKSAQKTPTKTSSKKTGAAKKGGAKKSAPIKKAIAKKSAAKKSAAKKSGASKSTKRR